MKKPADQLFAIAKPETGRVWYGSFPYPSEEFMSDFQWEVNTDPQHRPPFTTHSIRKLPNGDGTYSLNIRFIDRSRRPLNKRKKITVTLTHPSV